MTLDTSIENVGEYYSSHYLESTFAKDTQELLRRWKDEGADAVPRRLLRLGRAFFRAKEQALEIDEPRRRLKTRREALQAWHGLFLEALGYTRLEREDFPVDGGARHVPVLGRFERFGQPWLVVCETAFCLPDGSLPDGAPSEDPFDLRPLHCQLIDPEQVRAEKTPRSLQLKPSALSTAWVKTPRPCSTWCRDDTTLPGQPLETQALAPHPRRRCLLRRQRTRHHRMTWEVAKCDQTGYHHLQSVRGHSPSRPRCQPIRRGKQCPPSAKSWNI